MMYIGLSKFEVSKLSLQPSLYLCGNVAQSVGNRHMFQLDPHHYYCIHCVNTSHTLPTNMPLCNKVVFADALGTEVSHCQVSQSIAADAAQAPT